MRNRIVFLLIGAIILQPFLDYVAGQRFEFLFLGSYWMPLQLISAACVAIWLMTWPIEEKYRLKYRNARRHDWYTAVFAIAVLLILIEAWRGSAKGYRTVWADTETLLTISAVAAIGTSIHLDERMMHLLTSMFEKGVYILALLTTIHSILANWTNVPLPGFIHYNAGILLALGFIVGFVKAVILGERKYNLFLLTMCLALLTSLNKAVILPLLFCLPVLMQVAHHRWGYNPLAGSRPLLGFLAVVLVAAGVVAIASVLAPSSVGAYYINYAENRILHGTAIDEFNWFQLSGGRTQLWDWSLQAFFQNPWIGHGIGFRLVGYDLVIMVDGISPHNQYLYFLTTVGVVGFMPIMALFAMYVSRIAWGTDSQLRNNELVIGELYMFGYCCFMLLFGLIGMWSISPSGYTLFGLFLGLSSNLVSHRHATERLVCRPLQFGRA